MYVGDSLARDVQGAAEVGMTTVQALWFRADDNTSGIEPDFLAFTPMDVLNAVRRLAL
jgi:FMN phosphatase YigB (HAD superfamily)